MSDMAVKQEMTQNAESNESHDEVSLKEVQHFTHLIVQKCQIILARMDLKLICSRATLSHIINTNTIYHNFPGAQFNLRLACKILRSPLRQFSR